MKVLAILLAITAFALPGISQDRKPHKPFLRDAPVLFLAGIQTAAQTYDGITTKRFERYSASGINLADNTDPIFIYKEHDPISRLLLGPKPTWARMAPIGAIQIVGSAYLAHYIRTRRSWVHHIWWVPQALEIATSLTEGSQNLRASNAGLVALCNKYGNIDCH